MIFENVDAFRRSGFAPQVCIVGSGPAGVSLALGLSRKGIACLVVEGGGLDFSPDGQDSYRGQVVGDKYFDLDIARQRCFGGTSGHWAGWCRALDAIDFEARAGYSPHGWPIRKPDLLPYARTTEEILEIAPMRPDLPLNAHLSEVFFSFSPPVRFGQKYRKEFADSQRLALLTDATTTDIVPNNDRIESITVAASDGKSASIKAPIFCLCTGGIENSRLLLWANAQHANGVVRRPQALGRYWMEHPIFGVGDALATSDPGFGIGGARYIAPSEALLRSRPIGSFGLRFYVGDSRASRLIKAAMCVAPQFVDDFVRRYKGEYACGLQLRAAWEQQPLESNRIELGREKDRCGIPRTELHWRKSPKDRETVEAAVGLFGKYMIDADMGRMKMVDWLAKAQPYPDQEELAGYHHMGGTRMADSAEHGVVDAQCKVFGMDNLYVGGSSLFPSGGHCNPTYTIVQLSLRMADHLAARIGREATRAPSAKPASALAPRG